MSVVAMFKMILLLFLLVTVCDGETNDDYFTGNLGGSIGGGAFYTRWGHRQCDSTNAKLIYSGFTAGGFWTHSGGQTNVLCLPPNPQKSKDTRKFTWNTYIYGSEYETYGGPKGSPTNHDVPCAVCQSSVGQNSLMIAGYKTCPGKMNLEYRGFLMGGYFGHKAAHESVCMDKAMQSLQGGYDDKNGLLWYFVLTQCGSLRCPPYGKNEKLPCVVCSS